MVNYTTRYNYTIYIGYAKILAYMHVAKIKD